MTHHEALSYDPEPPDCDGILDHQFYDVIDSLLMSVCRCRRCGERIATTDTVGPLNRPVEVAA